MIAPGQVVPNLVAGAIAEAGAQQAGDMMQDFKTAHLLGVCPRAQFYAMLIGSAASVFVSVAAYALYTSAFVIPGPEFPAPTAEIWLDMAELVCSSGSTPFKLDMGLGRVGYAVVRMECLCAPGVQPLADLAEWYYACYKCMLVAIRF